MEVHLEQKQEPGLVAMGITKLHCSQIPEIPIQSPIHHHLFAGQALKYPPPKHSTFPTEPGDSTSPTPTGLPVPTQVLRGECVTAPTRGKSHKPQGQLRGARGLAGHKV